MTGIMDRIINLLKKNRDAASYLFFGVCTTVINIASYYLCHDMMCIANMPSTGIAWFLAVVFAYITNKLFVFNSKSFSSEVFIKEIISFFSCRLFTGLLDATIMYVSVDILQMNSTLWKLLSNILVIIINYILSKMLIFRHK